MGVAAALPPTHLDRSLLPNLSRRPLAPTVDEYGRRGCFAQLSAVEDYSEAAEVVVSPEAVRQGVALHCCGGGGGGQPGGGGAGGRW